MSIYNQVQFCGKLLQDQATIIKSADGHNIYSLLLSLKLVDTTEKNIIDDHSFMQVAVQTTPLVAHNASVSRHLSLMPVDFSKLQNVANNQSCRSKQVPQMSQRDGVFSVINHVFLHFASQDDLVRCWTYIRTQNGKEFFIRGRFYAQDSVERSFLHCSLSPLNAIEATHVLLFDEDFRRTTPQEQQFFIEKFVHGSEVVSIDKEQFKLSSCPCEASFEDPFYSKTQCTNWACVPYRNMKVELRNRRGDFVTRSFSACSQWTLQNTLATGSWIEPQGKRMVSALQMHAEGKNEMVSPVLYSHKRMKAEVCFSLLNFINTLQARVKNQTETLLFKKQSDYCAAHKSMEDIQRFVTTCSEKERLKLLGVKWEPRTYQKLMPACQAQDQQKPWKVKPSVA